MPYADLEKGKSYAEQYRKNNKDKINAYAKEYREKNKDIIKEKTPIQAKKTKLKHKYGMTLEDYYNMVKEQDGKCAICGSKEERRLVVDHNHVTGEIRGLLCDACNFAIGFMKDNPDTLLNAHKYLLGNK